MSAVLSIKDLAAGYSKLQIISRVTMEVLQGDRVGIIGPNGAGKSTLINAITGIAQIFSGDIRFKNADITRLPTAARIKLGIACVPEGRRLFPKMSVLENLVIAGESVGMRRDAINESLEYVYSLFPKLKDRGSQLAETLSGGEQQMLAIGRSLVGKPELILLDEPSQGLAPRVLNEVYEALTRLSETRIAMVVVEQQVGKILGFSQRVYVLDRGKVAYSGDPEGAKKVFGEVYIG